MKKLIFALIAGATAMSAAQAQSPYVGLGVSASDHTYKIGGGTNVDGDGWKGSAKIYGGVDINPMWAVETGFTKLTKADVNYNIGNARAGGEVDGRRAYVAAKASVPVNDQVSVYGKLGAGYTKTKFNGTGLSLADSDTGVYAGLGAQYKINDRTALTMEYERYGKQKDFGAKADAVTLGARYNF